MAHRETAEVLRKAWRVYDMARLGLDDLLGPDPRRRTPGFWNAVTFGRNVTFALQGLRHIPEIGEAKFSAWYSPQVEAMRADQLMQYFNKLRSVIEKEGGPDTGNSMYIEHLDSADLAPLMADPPTGAKSFFIGDRLGGNGWEVELPDGTIEHYYVALPDTVRYTWSMTLPDAPSSHLGAPITDHSVQNLCTLFLAYIGRVLAEAEAHFGGQVRLH
jgi:hypothetical protein